LIFSKPKVPPPPQNVKNITSGTPLDIFTTQSAPSKEFAKINLPRPRPMKFQLLCFYGGSFFGFGMVENSFKNFKKSL
jgi:hypothetical protein